MPSTTEIVTVSLKPGSAIGDPSNAAAIVLKEVANTLSKQDGFQQVQFGMQIENPDVIQLMINWDSLDKHKAFIASPQYGPFFKSFGSIVASTPKIIHADFETASSLAKALSAPVTEVAIFYFDGPEPADYLSGVQNFHHIMEKEGAAHGYVASAVGITYEEDLVKEEGKKGKAAVLVIGWKAVEDHLKFREHAIFKENIGALRNGVVGAEMNHVQFMGFVPDNE